MVTRLTLWEIASNPDDIVVGAAGPDENGLFSGWISRGPGHNYKPLISSSACFPSESEAKEYMQMIVDFSKGWTEKDIQNTDSPLMKLLGCDSLEEFRAIKKIVQAAKSPQ